ncbi:CLUMA_CG011273, isoform A [Clunio marinus]|uniref:CLUMA_CG011273, isoform A n=1 Tax=Clunio marinus TaxID=568069 RepID=A0A1J1IDR4_9DIPT|nr:CLUMA_CG011273, isoform A [Clunio marinus]
MHQKDQQPPLRKTQITFHPSGHEEFMMTLHEIAEKSSREWEKQRSNKSLEKNRKSCSTNYMTSLQASD